MESAINAVVSIFDKLKIKEVIFVVGVICSIILFLPVKYLKILGLDKFQSDYKSNVGIIFLFCCIFCIIWVIKFIVEHIKNFINSDEKALKKLTKGYLKKNISEQEKEYLIQNFYDFSHKEFKLSATLDMTNGCIIPLESSGIIYRAATASYSKVKWSYNLQPYARKLLNDAVRKKKIDVVPNNQGFSWRWRI